MFASSRELIRRGLFSYGWTHHPVWQVSQHPSTFSFVSFRDPVARIISYYRYLLNRPPGYEWHRDFYAAHADPLMVSGGFDSFLDRLPRSLRLHQLYMFSRHEDISEAAGQALRCDAVLFTETLEEDVTNLGRRLGLNLPVARERESIAPTDISEAQIERARELLDPEYQFLDLLRQSRPPSPRATGDGVRADTEADRSVPSGS